MSGSCLASAINAIPCCSGLLIIITVSGHFLSLYYFYQPHRKPSFTHTYRFLSYIFFFTHSLSFFLSLDFLRAHIGSSFVHMFKSTRSVIFFHLNVPLYFKQAIPFHSHYFTQILVVDTLTLSSFFLTSFHTFLMFLVVLIVSHAHVHSPTPDFFNRKLKTCFTDSCSRLPRTPPSPLWLTSRTPYPVQKKKNEKDYSHIR